MTWDGGICRFASHCAIHNGSRPELWKGDWMSRETVLEIRASDASAPVLARRLEMSVQMIYRIRRGITYRSVT